MAPEVIACETSTEEPYTCSADIWSFGQLFLSCCVAVAVTYLFHYFCLRLEHRRILQESDNFSCWSTECCVVYTVYHSVCLLIELRILYVSHKF